MSEQVFTNEGKTICTMSAQRIASALKAGQSSGSPHEYGDYTFGSNEVWEFNPDSEETRQKSTSIGEWLHGLVEVCQVEVSAEKLADVAYYLGQMVNES
jgi:hypothetical protein